MRTFLGSYGLLYFGTISDIVWPHLCPVKYIYDDRGFFFWNYGFLYFILYLFVPI